ncbi:MAG TPA: transglutaminaseTgpA domain-containing protein, partial [Trebonia sp.]
MASHRRTAFAALAVILASISLYPIFIGALWFWAGCGSVAVVALTGTATRLRRLPVALVLLAGAAALLLYLNAAFSNARSLYHLLPTPASLAELCSLAGQGFDQASRYAPPVPELRGMVLLAAAGIGIAALLTDLIAVRLNSAALAGLPLLLLFTEPFTLSVSRGFVGTTVAFCATVAGYLALLSSEARDRIREWEQQDPAARDAPDTRPLAATGRRVGFASVALALLVPLVIPGLHTTRLFGGGQPGIGGTGGHGASGSIGLPDPITQLSQELHSGAASHVLTYTTTAGTPDYLQIYTTDELTESGWQLFGQPRSLVSVKPQLPAPPGLATSAGTPKVTTAISVGANVSNDYLDALPVPYPSTAVSSSGTLQADRSTLMLFDHGVTLGGLKYTVTSLAENPTSQSLNAVAPSSGLPAAYLRVPASYDSLRPLAARITGQAGAKTEYQEAVALQDYLSGGTFGYTLKAPSVVNAAGLANFLNVTRQGYCQQFAFAMATLARLLGIPSRIAWGFTSGTQQTNGSWLVTTHDAHSWPELWFQGYGWLRFEPTPAGSAAGEGTAFAPGYTSANSNPTPQGGLQTAPVTVPTGTAAGRKGNLPPNETAGGGGAGGTGAAGSGAGLNPWEISGLVAAGLAALAAVAPGCARWVIRRRRWRGRR